MIKDNPLILIKKSQSDFFKNGNTLDIKTRIRLLKALKQSVKAHESDITLALKKDLGKPTAEIWLAEIYIVLDELNTVDIVEDRKKIASDGLSTAYYKLPEHATELRHLISHKSMSKSRGDIFKACYRLGEKDGTDVLYDLNKMKFFIDDLIEMHSRGEHL